MSQTTYCTNCGKQISVTARFCRFCGTSIRRTQSEPSPSLVERSPQPVHAQPSQSSRPPQPEVVETIPESIIDVLYARKRKIQIKSELKSLLKDVDELSKKVEIGLIDDAESAKQSEKIQGRISSLQKEKSELIVQPLDIEIFSEDEKKMHERLERIEEKNRSGAVSRAVYDSLKDEYSTELATSQRKKATEERKVKRWLVDLQKEVRILETKIESLKVRSEIEGNLEDDNNQIISNLTQSRVKKATAAEVLTDILQKV
ncbi:MAG: zinc-ribbon domain-containing protein [Candidatus Hodarchaeales archaeon]